MANQGHIEILLKGAQEWNQWRKDTHTEMADFSGHKFQDHTSFEGYNLYRCNFSNCDLSEARFYGKISYCEFKGAKLIMAYMDGIEINESNFDGADLTAAILTNSRIRICSFVGSAFAGVYLSGSILQNLDMSRASIFETDLTFCTLAGIDFKEAVLKESKIYGISVWDINTEGTRQESLYIGNGDDSIIVDDLEVAQFIYLILTRQKLRNVINALTSKAVLILGRFSPERKVVLDAIANEVRNNNLLPIIFDFDGPETRSTTETIKILAGLSLFVIADITNPKSSPLELQATVPDFQIPFVAIIEEGQKPFSMFRDLKDYPWVVGPIVYKSIEDILAGFKKGVLDQAWEMHKIIQSKKTAIIEMQSFVDFTD